MRAMLCFLASTVLYGPPVHADDPALAARLQNLSVTVHANHVQGSGTLVTYKDQNFILTAGHVVEPNRKVTKTVEDGKVIVDVRFDSLTVEKEIYVDGRSVGHTAVEAEVIAYSSADYGHDVALLKLRSKIIDETAEFADGIVPPGTDLIHVGSLLGQEGSNSFTTGSLSQVGRTFEDRVYDQSSCPSFPGSSGGGIFLRSNGKYLGMLTRGAGETFNLFVPVRRIRDWAKEHRITFLFDPKVDCDLSKIKLETREPISSGSGND